jgi:hypothetical protein
MRWALAFHPEQVRVLSNGRSRLVVPPMQIAESCIPAAVGQGWIVIVSDSDVLTPRSDTDDDGA